MRQNVLFSLGDYLPGNGRPQYDVDPSGQKFVMLRRDDLATSDIVVVVNWFEELKERTGGS